MTKTVPCEATASTTRKPPFKHEHSADYEVDHAFDNIDEVTLQTQDEEQEWSYAWWLPTEFGMTREKWGPLGGKTVRITVTIEEVEEGS